MIELYDIIEAANTFIKEGTLVLHRNMKVHSKFKVYKRFCYDLYYIKNSNKTLLFSYEELKNTPNDEIIKVWSECDKSYLRELIKWFTSINFKSMINEI